MTDLYDLNHNKFSVKVLEPHKSKSRKGKETTVYATLPRFNTNERVVIEHVNPEKWQLGVYTMLFRILSRIDDMIEELQSQRELVLREMDKFVDAKPEVNNEG